MLRWPEPRKSSCLPRSSEANTKKAKGLRRKRTTAGRSGSGSDGSVVKPLQHLARQVGDEKMLEKLTTHGIQDVSVLFSLADKCTRAVEGPA
jgi:hypothetical protein